MMEKKGEVIELTWEDWMPGALYVRGHVVPDEANAALDHHYGDDMRFSYPRHAYARWSCESGHDGDGQVLREYDTPDRGRFPVMVATVTQRQIGYPTWTERRERGIWNRELKRWERPGPFGLCDCFDHRVSKCGCVGECPCHWSPAIGEFWRIGDGD